MLKKNLLNEFNVTIVFNNIEYLNQKIFIEFIVGSDKKYYYKIITNFDNSDLEYLKNYFLDEFIEGVKGFGKHIISNEKFNLVLNDKKKILELITFDNSLFINGILL